MSQTARCAEFIICIVNDSYLLFTFCTFYWPRGSDGLYCFRRSFFFCMHDNINYEPLYLGRWNFARTCILTTAETELIFKIISQRSMSLFRQWTKFHQIVFPNVGKIVADNAVFRLSIVWSVPQIFAIEVQSCPKSSALLITHEPLHLAWWNFARTCISITSRTLSNFKAIGRSIVFLCFFLCAWCCGYPRTVLSLEALEQGLII